MFSIASVFFALFSVVSFSSTKDEQNIETECICGNGVQEANPQNLANPSCPYKLYATTALSPSTTSELFFVNPYDGQTTLVGPIMTAGGMAIRRVSSLDFSPEGVLYGIGVGTQAPYNNASVLITINCQTAEAVVKGDIGITQGSGVAFTDMNFDQYGRLIVYLKNSPTSQPSADQIGMMNVETGAYTQIGLTGLNDIGNGIAFSNFTTYPTQPLYHAGYINLNLLDIMLGTGSSVANLSFVDPANSRPRINAMDTDFLTNILYVSANDKAAASGSPAENYLGTMNLGTGVFSFIHLPAMTVEDGLDGLAFNRLYEECDVGTTIPDGTVCGSNCYLQETDCDNSIDDDFDGLIDCDDPDCDLQACNSDSCILGQTCASGSCQGGTPKDCDDSNDCTNDSCDSGTGDCINVIDENNSCTDFNPCTSDSCNSSGLCDSVNLPNGTACDDESICTENDECQNGQCVGAPVAEQCSNTIDDDCDGLTDGDDPDCAPPPTIEDICDDGLDNDGDTNIDCADSDCNGLPCQSDNDPCTDDLCLFGFCDHQTDDTNTCSDGNACTDDACVIGVCVGTNDNTNTCNDADPCTLNDACSAGTCVGTPVVCNDSNVCTNDVCIGGNCSYMALTGPTCASDGNQCTDDICNNGICTHPYDNTNTCSDGQSCTSGDTCSSGSCIGTPGVENCSNDVDDDCDLLIDENDPDCAPATLRVFVTSTTYSGNLGGTSGADAKCQARANAASLGGTWVAIVSSGTSNAIDRVINCNNKPWYLLSGAPNKIADNKADLFDNTIDQEIDENEFGAHVSGTVTWTGTNGNGTNNTDDCLDWTTGSSSRKGRFGKTDKTDSKWVSYGSASCDHLKRLYCFEIDTTCP